MKKQNILIIVILTVTMFLLSMGQIMAAEVLPADALSYLTHKYAIFYEDGTYNDAIAYCKSMGGHLATFSNRLENDAVYNYLKRKGYDTAYFGYRVENGIWSWVNGELSTYTNWHEGEPSDPNESYGEFYWKFTDGTWNDGDFGKNTQSDSKNIICEWDKDPLLESYKITYKLNGGTNNTKNPSTYKPSIGVTFKNPTRAGYKFLGWYMGDKAVKSIPKNIIGNVSVSAKWKIVDYKIVYKMNGGTNNEGNPKTYNVNQTFKLKKPTRNGFDFVGWYKNGEALTEITKGSTNNITLEARWVGKGNSVTNKPLKFNVTGTYEDGATNKVLQYTTQYDDAFFTEKKSTTLQKPLVKLSILAASAAYKANYSKALLENCGFIAKWKTNKVDNIDDNDHVSYTIGIRRTGNTTIVAILVKGTTKNYEWVSNFNIGEEGVTHEGFNKAKKELWNQTRSHLINQGVLDSDGNPIGDVKFWIVGHSRGAAVANLLAFDLSKSKKYGKENVYAYTFASPRVSTNAKNTESKYNNIFNFLNPGDFVTELAPKKWGFYRYGQDIILVNSKKAAMQESFKKATGVNYGGYGTKGKESLIKSFLYFAGNNVESYYYKDFVREFFQDGLGVFLAGRNYGLITMALIARADADAAIVLGKLIVDSKINNKIYHAHTQAGYLYWLDAMYK